MEKNRALINKTLHTTVNRTLTVRTYDVKFTNKEE